MADWSEEVLAAEEQNAEIASEDTRLTPGRESVERSMQQIVEFS